MYAVENLADQIGLIILVRNSFISSLVCCCWVLSCSNLIYTPQANSQKHHCAQNLILTNCTGEWPSSLFYKPYIALADSNSSHKLGTFWESVNLIVISIISPDQIGRSASRMMFRIKDRIGHLEGWAKYDKCRFTYRKFWVVDSNGKQQLLLLLIESRLLLLIFFPSDVVKMVCIMICTTRNFQRSFTVHPIRPLVAFRTSEVEATLWNAPQV